MLIKPTSNITYEFVIIALLSPIWLNHISSFIDEFIR